MFFVFYFPYLFRIVTMRGFIERNVLFECDDFSQLMTYASLIQISERMNSYPNSGTNYCSRTLYFI